MITHILPLSNAAHLLVSTHIPCGLVQLGAHPVLVILPLYHAGAYPQHYYTSPVTTDLKLELATNNA